MRDKVIAAVAAVALLGAGAVAVPTSNAYATTVKAVASGKYQPSGAPGGYQIVFGGPYTVGADSWQLQTLTCPGAKQPIIGGIKDTNPPNGFNVGSSWPDGATRRWLVIANNLSGTATTYYEYVVCLASSGSYAVHSGSISALADATSTAYLYCPAGLAVGGGVQSVIDLGLGINSSLPSSDKSHWQLEVSNADSTSYTLTGYSVCHAKPAGYSLQGSVTAGLAPGGSVTLTATCPSGSVPLSGGGYTTLPQPYGGGYMSSSYPTSNGWTSKFYDGANSNMIAEATAICAS